MEDSGFLTSSHWKHQKGLIVQPTGMNWCVNASLAFLRCVFGSPGGSSMSSGSWDSLREKLWSMRGLRIHSWPRHLHRPVPTNNTLRNTETHTHTLPITSYTWHSFSWTFTNPSAWLIQYFRLWELSYYQDTQKNAVIPPDWSHDPGWDDINLVPPSPQIMRNPLNKAAKKQNNTALHLFIYNCQ